MLNGEKGQALAAVIILTAFIYLLGGGALVLSYSARIITVGEVEQKKAYYISEAGIEKALARAKYGKGPEGQIWLDQLIEGQRVEMLELEGAYPGDYSKGALETVIFTRNGLGDLGESRIPVTIESTGRYGNSKKKLGVKAELFWPIDFREAVQALDEPTMEPEWFELNADHGGFDPYVDLTSLDGFYYLEEALNISGTYMGVGTIVSMGKIVVDGDLTAGDSDSSIALISFSEAGDGSGGIEISQNSVVEALLYCPDKIFVGSNSAISGSLISRRVEMGPSPDTTAQYDESLVETWRQSVGRSVRILSWKEE